MRKANGALSLLDKIKKLSENKQNRMIMIALGVFLLVLFVIILAFCTSGGEGEPQEPIGNEPEIEVIPDVYYITAYENSSINVRKEPTRNSDRLLSIGAGDISVKLKYLGESRFNEDYFWYSVMLPDGRSGWVREDVVTFDDSPPPAIDNTDNIDGIDD